MRSGQFTFKSSFLQAFFSGGGGGRRENHSLTVSNPHLVFDQFIPHFLDIVIII